VLSLGAVLAYDMIKALQTVIEDNAVRSPGVAVSWIKSSDGRTTGVTRSGPAAACPP
jgi:hypothetical protein